MRLFHWIPRFGHHRELTPVAGEVLDINCQSCGQHVLTVTPDDAPAPAPLAPPVEPVPADAAAATPAADQVQEPVPASVPAPGLAPAAHAGEDGPAAA